MVALLALAAGSLSLSAVFTRAQLPPGCTSDDAIVGTPEDDKLKGTKFDDVIFGGGGDDVIKGKGGNDLICSRGGNDQVKGGNGDDTILGGGGDDDLRGGPGNDTITGGAGTDTADGGVDTDSCDAETETNCEEATPSPSPTATPSPTPTTTASPTPTPPTSPPVNHKPVAGDDTFSTDEDQTKNVAAPGVLANDSDPEGDFITAELMTGPSNGTLTLNPNGSFQYVPNPNYNGADSFTYAAKDSVQLSLPATVTINVASIPDAPSATAQSFVTDEDTHEVVTLFGSDPDGPAPSTFKITSLPTDGDLRDGSGLGGQLITAGDLPFTLGGNTVTYVPDPNFFGSDGFTFKANDGALDSPNANVSAVVAAVNDAPTNIGLSNNSVEEEQAAGATVGTLSATDPDTGDTHNYTLAAGAGDTDNARFTIAAGVLKTAESFDFETQGPFSIRVRTTDAAGAPFEKQFNVTLINVNDSPVVQAATFSLPENSANGTAVGTPTVTDQDAAQTHTWSITAGNSGSAFAIDANTGAITVADTNELDFEDVQQWVLTVRAEDNGAPAKADTDTVTINLTNVNEAPDDITLSSSSVDENEPIGTAVGNLAPIDPDAGDSHSFSLVSGTGDGDNGKFQIDNGVLKTAQVFDFETQGPFSIRIRTTDAGSLQYEEVFSISVGDVNDAPVVSPATFSLDENSANGTSAGTVSATDEDTPAQTLTYSITGGNATGAFSINSSTGEITVADAGDLDYETISSFALTVAATDDGTPNEDDSDTITINLNDVNEAPVVDALTFSLAENSPNGTSVGSATLTEPDGGQTHTWAITAGNTGGAFQINPSTGEITVADTNDVDFETNHPFALTVEATDNGAPALSDTDTVTVNLTNVNEVPTDISLDDTSVAENASLNTVVGTLSGSDPDAGDSASLVFSLASGTGDADNARFNVGPSNSLRTSEVFDKETQGPFSIRLRATDGGNLQYEEVFSITIDDVNEQPDVSAATFSLAENSANGTSAGTPTLTDQDSGQSHTWSITAGNTGGAFQINANTGEITVADTNDVDFETNHPFSLTVEATDNGTPPLGDSATITINLTDVNDAPTVTAAALSLAENSANGTSAGTVNATDQDSPAQTLTFAITGGNTGGAFQINPSTGEITVADTNDVDYETNHPFSLTVEATDNGTPNRTGSNTITVNLTNVNEAPVITAPATVSAQYQVAKAISGISVADPDAGNNALVMTLSVLDGTLNLDTTVANGLTPGDVAGNGTDVLALGGTLTKLNNTFGAANGLTYTSDSGFSGLSDTLALVVNDGGNSGSGSPQSDSENVTIQFNTPPVVVDLDPITDEDTEKTITLSGTDADSDPLTYKITTLPASGKLHEGTSSAGTLITSVPHTLPGGGDKVTYVPPANQNGTNLETFQYVANDGFVDSAPGVVTVDVTAVNDPPDLGNTGGNLSYQENDPATAITSGITLSDVDTPMMTGATVQITGNYANGQDVLGYPGGFSITPSAFNAATGTLTLSGTTTLANYVSALEAVTYENTSHNPSELTRTVTFTVTDGALQDSATAGVDVTEINDVPAIATPGADMSYIENEAAKAIHSTMTVTDVDHTQATGATVQITGNYQNGQDVLSFVNTPNVTGNWAAGTGTLTLSGTTSFANYEAALQTVKYHNTSENPSSLTRTVTFTVNDGEGNGTDTHGITVTPVNDAPIADLDTLSGNKSALANTTLDNGVNSAEAIHIDTASNENILDGDFDHEGDTFSLVAGADCTGSAPFTCTTDQGGTVKLASSGLFEYNPPAGHTGTDSFDYRVSDGQPVNPTSDGTVNINVAGPLVWYVDDGAPSGGNGTSSSMFQTLAPLSTGGGSDSKDTAGDRIFVHAGTYTSGIVLENNQKLIGQPHGFTVSDTVSRTHNLLAAGGSAPAISHASNTVVALGSGNELQDLALGNGTIALGGTSVGNATVKDSSINTNGKAVDINGGNLDMTFTNVSSNGSASEAIKLNNATGTFDAAAGTLQNATNAVVDISNAAQTFTYSGNISDNTGKLVSITGTTGGTKDFNGTIAASNSSGGSGARIDLANNGGSTIRFDNDLSLVTQALPAFSATGGGTVHVTSDDNVLTTTTGTPLNVVNTTIGAGDLIFDSISSNGAANGIVLDNTGSTGNLNVTGTGPAASGGTIASTTGADAATTSCTKPSAQPPGIGILLKDTNSVMLQDVVVNGSDNFGLLAHDVNGLTMDDSSFTGTHGTNENEDEGSAYFCDLTGTVDVSDSTVGGGYESSFKVQNTAGTLDLDVTSSNFATSTSAVADDAFAADGFGTSTFNVDVAGSTFTTARGDLLDYTLGNTATGDLQLTGSTFTNNHSSIVSGGGGITIGAGGLGSNPTWTYNVTNNDFSGARGSAVTITSGVGAGTYTGTISDNDIGITGVVESGSFGSGHGIALTHQGTGLHKVQILNNRVRQYGDRGIDINAVDGSPTLKATIQGNLVTEPGDAVTNFAGIRVTAGALVSDTTTMCIDMGSLTPALKNSVSNSHASNTRDISIRSGGGSAAWTFPNNGVPFADFTAVAAYLTARNDGDGTPVVGPESKSLNASPTYSGTGANCL